MQHVSNNRKTDDRGAAAVEALLRAAAKWQPERPIAAGMLADTIARRTRMPRANMARWRWAVAFAPIGAALTLALVMPRDLGKIDRTSPRPRTTSALSVGADQSFVADAKTRDAAAGNQSKPASDVRRNAGRRAPVRISRKTTRVGHRPAGGVRPQTMSGVPSEPSRTTAWTTYSVPRYVAGVSTAAWIRANAPDGEPEYVPAVLDVPLGEMYGEPSDDHSIELDVVPVRYVMEEFNE